MPEIAIITSMYNAEDTIVETIHSVVNQSYENWEWFIMDDGSSDASRKLVLENTSHESRIHYINCGRIGHIGVLRNRGSKIASAPYLNFLDADDQLLPGFLDKQITLMRKSCAAVAHTHANIINAGEVGKIPLRYTGPNICQPPEMFKHLKHQNPIFSPSVVLGADAFKRCGRFSENKYHFSNLDGNLWLRMARDQTFVFHPEPLINYRLSPTHTHTCMHAHTRMHALTYIFIDWAGLFAFSLAPFLTHSLLHLLVCSVASMLTPIVCFLHFKMMMMK